MDPITLIMTALAASQGAWGSYCAVGRPELGRIGDGPFGHTELSSSPS